MTFSLFDTGNLVVSFDQEHAAQAALDRIVQEDPEAADRVVVIVFDDAGHAVDDFAPGDRIAV